ncbi:MAG: J domain-containing protein [Candidatus Omnitrophica bacterium]|nr:J domain-containing protein [Candidatus Omnitrophota bacterium]
MKKNIIFLTIVIFAVTALLGVLREGSPQAAVYDLPLPDQLLSLSEDYSPPVLKGLRFHPQDPLNIEFIVDSGSKEKIGKKEASRLIRYFLAGLTLSQEELWVNLSPYEGDRIATNDLSVTDLGKDLLGQDYILKQLASSLTYPESETGKEYWRQIYDRVGAIHESPAIATHNKVWIMPDKSVVYENEDVVYITESTMKIMLESDYVALRATDHRPKTIDQFDRTGTCTGSPDVVGDRYVSPEAKQINQTTSRLMREIILPKISHDVNYGKNFTTLRQIYHSLILAVWFKDKFQDTFYQHYIDHGKITGIDLEDKGAKDKIYDLYVEAYKRGVYDYLKKEYDPALRKKINRRYFSGGVVAPSADSLDRSGQLPENPKATGVIRGGVRSVKDGGDLGAQFGGDLKFMAKFLAQTEIFYKATHRKRAKYREKSSKDMTPRDLVEYFLEYIDLPLSGGESDQLAKKRVLAGENLAMALDEALRRLSNHITRKQARKARAIEVLLIDLPQDKYGKKFKEEVIDPDGGIGGINYQGLDEVWRVIMLERDLKRYRGRYPSTLIHELMELVLRQENPSWHWIKAHNVVCNIEWERAGKPEGGPQGLIKEDGIEKEQNEIGAGGENSLDVRKRLIEALRLGNSELDLGSFGADETEAWALYGKAYTAFLSYTEGRNFDIEIMFEMIAICLESGRTTMNEAIDRMAEELPPLQKDWVLEVIRSEKTDEFNPYVILEVNQDAFYDEINSKYRELAMKCHPDQNPDDDAATEKFKDLGKAFAILSNSQYRAVYDKNGFGAVQARMSEDLKRKSDANLRKFHAESVGGIDVTGGSFNLKRQGQGMDISSFNPLGTDYDGLVFMISSIEDASSLKLTQILNQK